MNPIKRTLVVLFSVLTLAACGDREEPAAADTPVAAPAMEGPLVIYAGRREALVASVVERFRAATGIEVEVRYGDDAELLALLEEEGAASRADLFWANTAGALGAAANANLLAPLPDSLLARPAAFVPSGRTWTPVTTRFRVLAYAPERIQASALPASALDLPAQTALRGRIGWTPTYSSFQDFVTALRLQSGEDSARAWLQGMKALEPKAYPSNSPMLEALLAGEIDVALTNHYYVLRITEGEGEGEGDGDEMATEGAEDEIAVHRFAPGDVGNLALVTGAGVLRTGDGRAGNRAAALRFLAFLLTQAEQTAAAAENFEYPVVRNAAVPADSPAFEEAIGLSPQLDFEGLRDLEATLALLRDEDLL